MSKGLGEKMRTRVPAFLEAFRITASVAAAARIAGISRRAHYVRLEIDEAYRKAFTLAQTEVADVIEGELFRRAVHGEKEPVFHRGKKVATITRRSDQLLIFIARGAMPGKYREHVVQEHSGSIDLIQRLESARARLLAVEREEDEKAS